MFMFCLTHLKITLQKVLNLLELMLPHGILKISIEFNKNQRKSMGDRTEGKGSVNWGLETSPMSCDKWA